MYIYSNLIIFSNGYNPIVVVVNTKVEISLMLLEQFSLCKIINNMR